MITVLNVNAPPVFDPFSTFRIEEGQVLKFSAFAFDPDRFAEPRREDHSHRMAFKAFGGGVHKCIGMYFAGVQVRSIFHELLRTYRWSVPADYRWPMDLVALPFPRDRLPVTLERI